jgi:exopolysaccharide biosynthesis polyprenyl glycosylphosphotransferase
MADVMSNRGNLEASPEQLKAPAIRDTLENGLYLSLKRFMDCTLAGLGILVLSPLLPVLALLIRWDSRGPIFYAQRRVGENGKEFQCWKFRSMCSDAERQRQALNERNQMDGGILFKIKDDPRITKLGRYLRKYSIDELPQLWNVFSGDMSLVGPRPPLPVEAAQYTPFERNRLSVKPGITCLWQISGRSDLPFDQQVKLDLKYIRLRSIALDLKILLQTVPAVLSARGAY